MKRRLLLVGIALALLAGCTEDNGPLQSLIETFGTTVPPQFLGITAISNLTVTSLQAEWGGADDDVTPASQIVYNLYLSNAAGGQEFNETLYSTIGTTFLALNGLSPGTDHCIVVRAEDQNGNEDANSAELCATTLPAGVGDVTPPVFAGIEAVDQVKPNSLTASWQPADDDTTPGSQVLYQVYSAAVSGGQDFTQPTTTTKGATVKGLAGLTPGSQYCLVVRAQDRTGHEDTNTIENCVTTPLDTTPPSFGGVTSIALTTLAPPEVTLGWTPAFDDNSPQAGITYRVFRGEVIGSQNFLTPLGAVTGSNTYLDTSVAPNATYYFVVRAVDELGNEEGNTKELGVSTPFASTGITYAYHPGLHDLGQAGAALALLDWNADGYLDLAMGTYNTGNPQSIGTGAYRGGQVSIYLGRSDGLFQNDPKVQFYSLNSAANGFFGRGLAACDITGDGTADDLVVGASGEQRVYIYLNTGPGQDTTPDRVIGAPVGQGDTDNFGETVACANINGTGGQELVVAAPQSDDNGAANSGTLYFYNNNSSPPVIDIAGPNASYFIYPQNDFVTQIPDNNQPFCGQGLAPADLDGNGTLDLAVGCPLADLAGANDGVIVFYTRPDFSDANTWVKAGFAAAPNDDDYWGWSLAAGNVDHADAGLELLVGQRYYDSPGVNAGGLFIYDVTFTPTAFSLSPPLAIITDRGSNGANAAFGSGLAVGDILGDGVTDLVVGAMDEDLEFIYGNTAADIGAVYLFRGTSGALLDPTAEQTTINAYEQADGTPVHGGAYDVRFGQAVCTGDIDNDGRADLLIGAENDPSDGKEAAARGTGRVYVWYSVATGEMDLAGPAGAHFTAPGFAPGKRFGSSCVVMDYNQDGLNDVVIGSQYADDANADQGAVYVYLGTPSTSTGGSNTGSVPVDGTPEITLVIPLATGTASHYFGSALAACDLTGDGNPELIVGARQFDAGVAVSGSGRGSTNEGAVFVFRGSAAGVTPANYQVIFPTNLNVGLSSFGTANYSDNNFGYALGCFPTVGASAGLDLIVGAPWAAKPGGNANQGMVAIFHGAVNQNPTVGGGSCSGNNEYVGTACMIDDTRDIRIDDQGPFANDDALFGSSIAVGDWNGANGPDLVIGAYRARGLAPAPDNNGGVYVFLGIAGGGFIDFSGGVPLSALSHLDPTGFSNNGFADSGLALDDLNNNGVPELIIGVNYCTYNNPVQKRRGTATGCVYVNRGDYRP